MDITGDVGIGRIYLDMKEAEIDGCYWRETKIWKEADLLDMMIQGFDMSEQDSGSLYYHPTMWSIDGFKRSTPNNKTPWTTCEVLHARQTKTAMCSHNSR